MRWGQVTVAIITALGATGYLFAQDWTLFAAGLVGLVCYFVIRWLIAWTCRTRYWYRRGTRGHYSTSCPDCSQYIYRRKRHWILRCGRCGWTAGWPGFRWVTQSVPARQMRRTVGGPRLLVVLLAVSVLAVGVGTDAAILYGDNTEDSVPNSSVFAGPGADPPQPDRTATPTTSSEGSTRIDTERAEQLILEQTSAVRRNHGLSILSSGDTATRFAEQHSRDMGVHNYYAHRGPNGVSAMERMERISAACGSTASENIHLAPLTSRVRIYGGEEIVNIYDESELAKYAVQGWMNSPGHRDNMLDERWSTAGVGVYVANENVYMTIVFC